MVARLVLPLLSFALVAASFTFFHSRSAAQMSALTEESGLYEIMSALALAAAAILFGLAYWQSKGRGLQLGPIRTRRNLIYLVFSLLMVVACGEELSWGQHILGYPTPGFIRERSEQDEVNIHNLSFFNAVVGGQVKEGLARQLTLSKMFSAFVFGLGAALPLAHAAFRFVRCINRRVRVPVPPLWMVPFLVITLLAVRVGPQQPLDAEPGALREVSEAMYAYALAVIAGYAMCSEHRRTLVR